MKEKTPTQIKTVIVSRALKLLEQRLDETKKNGKTVLELVAKIEADEELSAADKKQLVAKINSYYFLSHNALLELVDALSVREEAALPEQICITMADEVRKWAK